MALLCAAALPAAPLPEPELEALAVSAAAGSAAPHLAAGPDGTLVMNWMEPDGSGTALRYATLDADGWSDPHTVASGEDWFVNWADFPSVVPITGSLWAAHWLRGRPEGLYAYDVVIALSTDAGRTWSDPVVPHRDGTASEHGFVSLFPWGDGVGAIWLDGRHTVSAGDPHADDSPDGAHMSPGGMTLRSAVIGTGGELRAETEIDGLVCDCCQTDVAITDSGPVAVYRDRTAAEIRDIQVARVENGRWVSGGPVAEDGWEIAGCPVNGPAVAGRGPIVVTAWFTMAGARPVVRYARSSDGGRSFAPPVDLAVETPQGRVGVVLLDDGAAAVSWLDRAPGGNGEIVIRRVEADGTPGGRHVIARTEVTRPAGFPQIAVHGDHLIVAWTDSSGEMTRVKSARFPWQTLSR